jgi:hypothetical protein
MFRHRHFYKQIICSTKPGFSCVSYSFSIGQQIHCFYKTGMFIIAFTQSGKWTVSSQINPAHTVTPHTHQQFAFSHTTYISLRFLTFLVAFNPLKTKLIYILFKNPVRTSKRTPHFTITKINWLTLFKFNISTLYTCTYISSSLARQPYVGPGLPRKLLPVEVTSYYFFRFRDGFYPGWVCRPYAQSPAIPKGRCFLSGLSPLAD